MNDHSDHKHRGSENKKKSSLETAAGDLFDYAVDRQDIKWLVARLPAASQVNTSTVEYELQILKIIAVGWSITFHLENHPHKAPLAEIYWKAVAEFAQQLSHTTGLMIGQDIDYFNILKERLDLYLDALHQNPQAAEPAAVIGPEFAGLCGDADDMFVSMSGSKMVINAVTRVKQYLAAVGLC